MAAVSLGVVVHPPLSTAANMHWGSYNLWRQDALGPTINRPVSTGPLLYTDVRTGSCDPRSIRDSYEYAAKRAHYTPDTRYGDYLTEMEAHLSGALKASSCDRAAAPGPWQCDAHKCPVHTNPCATGEFPNAAGQEACMARFAGLEADGCACNIVK